MKERITFFPNEEDPYEPDQLHVKPTTLRVRSLKAAREDRLTFAFQELPQEVEEFAEPARI